MGSVPGASHGGCAGDHCPGRHLAGPGSRRSRRDHRRRSHRARCASRRDPAGVHPPAILEATPGPVRCRPQSLGPCAGPAPPGVRHPRCRDRGPGRPGRQPHSGRHRPGLRVGGPLHRQPGCRDRLRGGVGAAGQEPDQSRRAGHAGRCDRQSRRHRRASRPPRDGGGRCRLHPQQRGREGPDPESQPERCQGTRWSPSPSPTEPISEGLARASRLPSIRVVSSRPIRNPRSISSDAGSRASISEFASGIGPG